MKSLLHTYIIPLAILLLASCNEPNVTEAITPESQGVLLDSAVFVERFHYWVEDNFIALDTLHLQTLAGNIESEPYDIVPADSARQTVLPKEQVVVAEVLNVPEDSIPNWWIRVVTETNAQGWISQENLSTHLVPDSPISRFLHELETEQSKILLFFLLFTLLWALTAWGLRNRLGHLRTSYLFVPHLFSRKTSHHKSPRRDFYAVCTVLLWTLFLWNCRTIGWLNPALCEDYYFHPSLNFFTVDHLGMSFCLLTGWLTLISFVCASIEIFRTQAWRRAFFQMLRVLWLLVATYLVLRLFDSILWTTLCALLWFGYLSAHLHTLLQLRYICGYCGREIIHLGECPHCGKWNV